MSKSRPTPVGLPGIRARVVRGPREDGRWYWRIERSSTADKSVLECVWATSAEASKRVAELLAAGGARPEPAAAAELSTVDELLGAYIAHLEDTRPDLAASTLVSYRHRRRQIWRAGLGDIRLVRIHAADVDTMRASLLRRHAPQTVLGQLVHLASAWRWARREGLVPDRDFAVPKIKVPIRLRHTPSAAEIEAVLGELEHPWERLAVQLLWSTGCRIGEVAALTWSQIDLGRGELAVAGKTGPRRIPLGASAMQALREARIASAGAARLLSVTEGTCRRQLAVSIERACTALGQTVWTPHALRRAAVDALARSGVDVATAAALLGHSPLVMLRHYRQVSPDDLRAAVERARLGGPGSGRGRT